MKTNSLLIGVFAGLIILTVVGVFILTGEESPEGLNFGVDNSSGEAPVNPTPATDHSTNPAGKRQLIKDSQLPSSSPANPEKEHLSPVPGGWLVKVKEKETANPVAGATIYFADQARATNPAEFLRSSQANGADMEGFVRARGQAYRTDAKGETRVPKPISPCTYLAGRRGKLWAINLIKIMDTPPLILELEEEKAIQVIVIDKQGKPVGGAPVSLRQSQGQNRFYTIVQTVTDQAGLAHFKDLAGRLRAIRINPAQAKLDAALAIPLIRPVSESIDWQNLPTKPLTLTMPQTGQVAVTIMGPGGMALTCPSSISLTEYSSRNIHLAGAQPTIGGKSLFPFVGLGLRLKATGFLGEPKPHSTASTEGPGPTTPGETVELTISAKEDIPRLSLKILAPTGKPVINTTLKWQFTMIFSYGSRCYNQGIIRSDEKGLIVVPAFTSHEEYRTVLQVSTIDQDPLKTSSGRLTMQSIYPPGITDMGGLSLIKARPILAGIVVDTKGKPVTGAKLTIAEKFIYGKLQDLFWWNPIQGLEATSGPQGKFAFIGTTACPDLQVRTNKKGYKAPNPTEAAIGTGDLRIVLGQSGQMSGRVLLDKKIQGRLLRAQLNCEKDEGGTHRLSTSLTNGDGKFAFSSIPPGMASLTILIAEDGTEITTIKGIRITEGKEISDPRIKEIDLRGRLHILQLSFLDPKGVPIRNVNIKKGPQFKGNQSLHRSRSFFLATTPVVDIEVWAVGFLTKKHFSVSDGGRITLTPGPQILITVKGKLPNLPEGISIHINLQKSGGQQSYRPLNPSGTKFQLSDTGRYRVSLLMRKTAGDHLSHSSTFPGIPATIKVEPREEPQTFPIAIPPQRLEKALKWLEKM